MSTIETEAEALAEQYNLSGDPVEDIKEQLEELHHDYQVQIEEAVRSVESELQSQMDVDGSSGGPVDHSEFDPVSVKEATSQGEGAYVDLVVKYIEDWNPRSDDMLQVGLLADDTDTIKYVRWENIGGLPVLEKGKTYNVQNVQVEEYEGRYSVSCGNSTQIEEAESDIDTGGNGTTIEGLLVNVKRGSGLVKRCPDDDCNRVLRDSRCADHGNQDGFELDLRIKAVIDDGINTYDVVFTTKPTEELGGISVDEAEAIFKETLDSDPVDNEIEAAALGSYFQINGGDTDENIIVNDYEIIAEPSEDAIDELESRIIADEVANN